MSDPNGHLDLVDRPSERFTNLPGLDTVDLRELGLIGAGVTDKGLADLKGLTKLQVLYLGGTRVTDKGVDDFQRARRDVKVVR